jgi:hypothetical protein
MIKGSIGSADDPGSSTSLSAAPKEGSCGGMNGFSPPDVAGFTVHPASNVGQLPRPRVSRSPRLRGFLSERAEGGRDLSATVMEELKRFTGEGWEQEVDITLLTLRRSRPLVDLLRTP